MDELTLAHERIQNLYADAAFRAADRGDREEVDYWLSRMSKADQITEVHRQVNEILA